RRPARYSRQGWKSWSAFSGRGPRIEECMVFRIDAQNLGEHCDGHWPGKGVCDVTSAGILESLDEFGGNPPRQRLEAERACRRKKGQKLLTEARVLGRVLVEGRNWQTAHPDLERDRDRGRREGGCIARRGLDVLVARENPEPAMLVAVRYRALVAQCLIDGLGIDGQLGGPVVERAHQAVNSFVVQ